MPTIYNLNQPPHPFWDFVANLNVEDHPFFRGYARPPAYEPRDNVSQEQQQPEQPAGETEKAPEQASRQPTVEDDPDPNEEPPRRYRGIGENPNHKDQTEPAANPDREGPSCGRGRSRGEGPFDGPRRHHRGNHCGAPDGFRGRGGHHTRGGHHGPWWAAAPPFGPPPFGPPHRHGHGSHPHHHHSPHGESRRGGPGGFNLPEFLENLGNQLGLDLSGAAEGLGLSNPPKTRGDNHVDFEPRTDVFDTPAAYIVHASLPGANKSDVGVEYDAETSSLRLTGVVHRPGADEELLQALAVDGRKREVGVFEKAVRLGTRKQPANVIQEDIKAKMENGVLVVTVPRKAFEKTEIRVGSASPTETAAAQEPETNVSVPEQGQEVDMLSETEKGDDTPMEYEHETKKEQQPATEEHAEQQHEKTLTPDHSDEEGEYVRIDVD